MGYLRPIRPTVVGTLTPTDIGLGNVNNTADADKPLSTADIAALALKANASVTPPWLHATGAATIGTRASVVPSGYTGPILYNVSRFASWSGTITDQQAGDLRLRRA